MGVVGIVFCSLLGLLAVYLAGVYLYYFILRYRASKQPPLSEDEQRAADYAAYKAKM